MMERLRGLLEWAGGRGVLVLMAALVIVAGAWGFVALADEVKEGGTQRFDDAAIRALRRPDNPGKMRGPPWLEDAARDVTALGGVTVLGLVTTAVVGYLLICRKYHAMWLVLAATTGGLILSSLLKYVISRPRPELVPRLSYVYTSSFPSGHSFMSAVVYLTLGTLLMRLTPGRAIKLYLLLTALFLTFVVGVSRVCMAVHYPTDVLAGWTAGLAWALVCWLIARYLQRRHLVERDDDNVG